MRPLLTLVTLLFVFLMSACDSQTTQSGFDPGANPEAALEKALNEAKASRKNVLVIGGGDWCDWSRALESLISSDAEIRSSLDQNFVMLQVYFGEKNRNAAFFSKLPSTNVYPYFWVISQDGDVVDTADPSSLEEGSYKYNKTKFLELIQKLKNA